MTDVVDASEPADDPLALPADVVEWVATTTGGTVASVRRVPGGASREAWFVDVERADGTPWALFVSYSRFPHTKDSVFHPLRVEGEIISALWDTDVTVPRAIAVHPTRAALLEERVSGQTWFYRIKDPAEQVRVAQDFIVNLAALHRLDPSLLELPSLGPVRPAAVLALEEIGNMRRRATGGDGWIDPLTRLCLDWLERHVPAYDGPVVLVQGDTGPGNFMYEDGKVTAVVDWELAHLGDPMDDIAWLSLRTVQDTFTHFPDRIREYEELSGHRVDAARVWYYRLFAELRLLSNGMGAGRRVIDVDPDKPLARDIGNGLIYGVLHRRLTLEALAAAMGLDLEPVGLGTAPPPEEWHGLYNQLLANLQAIVPRIDDPLAAGWAKGAARLVKHLKELDLRGRTGRDQELEDLAELLGHRPMDLEGGRDELGRANEDGRVGDEDYVRYAWRRVQRDDELLRTASGALATRTWPPLTD
jgi:aminoglycoside phosphotransferase (APT) family kinase protein